MSSKSLLSALVLFTVLELVFGATCKNSPCAVSSFTTGVCNASTKICDCSGPAYVPIDTGCGRKLETPIVEIPEGSNWLVAYGKSASLTCSSKDGATLFQWTRNDTIISGATTNKYTTDDFFYGLDKVYKCKAKVAGHSNLDSDFSSGLQLRTLHGSTTNYTPSAYVIVSPETAVFTGKSVNISCGLIPQGYPTADILITDGTRTYKSPLKIDSTNQGKSVHCELVNTFQNTKPIVSTNLTTLPRIVNDISDVAIETTAVDNEVYSIAETITLKCVPTPDEPYVDTITKKIVYVWMNNSQAISSATLQTYNIPKTEGVHAITCQATYTNSFTSSVITITRSNTYLMKPVISAKLTTSLSGNRLILTCGSPVGGETYSWKKNGTDIVRHFEQIIQLEDVTASDKGAYTCTVRRSMITQTSDPFTFNAFITSVAIDDEMGYDKEVVLVDDFIVLKCVTTPNATSIEIQPRDIKYTWMRGGVSIPGETENLYFLPEEEGNYLIKCKASYINDAVSGIINITRSDTYLIKPIITGKITTSFSGRRLNISCGNALDGATYSWQKNDTDIPSYVEPTLQLNILSALDNGATYTCTAFRSLITMTSDPVIVNAFIRTVAIDPMVFDKQVFTVNEPVTLKCVTTPDATSVEIQPSAITYTWMKGNVLIPGATGQSYSLPAQEGNHLIKCQTSYINDAVSAIMNITRSDTYLTKPVITGKITTFSSGRRLNISCGNTLDGVTYSWKKNGADIPSYFEQTLQLEILSAQDNAAAYTCTAKRSMVTKTSDPVTVNAFIKTVAIDQMAFDKQVFTVNEPVTLKCVTTPDATSVEIQPSAITYTWMKGEFPILGATGQTYSLLAQEGNYLIKCQASYINDAVSGILNITRSDTYLIKPVITGKITTLLSGRRLNISCGNTLDGATYSWKKNGADIPSYFEPTLQLEILSALDNAAYTCTAKRSMITKTSDPVTVNAFIKTVAIDQMAFDKQVFTVNEPVTLKCVTTPEATSVEIQPSTITYTWMKGNDIILGAKEQTYSLATEEGNYLIKCQASYTNDAVSGILNITRSDTYLIKPVITGKITTFSSGRRLNISCGNTLDGATYSWKKNGADIPSYFEPTLQLEILSAQDNGAAYTCTAKRSMITKTSDPVTVNAFISSVAIDKMTFDKQVFTVNDPITLKCVTTPDATSIEIQPSAITYTWMKGDALIPGATALTYSLPTEEGNYLIKCKASYTNDAVSGIINITRSNTYLMKPVINASPAIPELDSSLTLTCGNSVDGGAYTWKKNDVDISSQSQIQFESLTTDDSGAYVCIVKKSMITQISESFNIDFSGAQMMAKVSLVIMGSMILLTRLFA